MLESTQAPDASDLLVQRAVGEKPIVGEASGEVLRVAGFGKEDVAGFGVAAHAVAVGVSDQCRTHASVFPHHGKETHRVLGNHPDQVRIAVAVGGRDRLMVHHDQHRGALGVRLAESLVEPSQPLFAEDAVVLARQGGLEQQQVPAP